MVYVPEGKFTMGSESVFPDERPVHAVYLDGFWIDRTEVTNAQYRRCVEAGVCNPPLEIESAFVVTLDTCFDRPICANYPVVSVTWYDAQTYCRWVGKRLPTEAEWEKAARGTDGWIYPWGNEFDQTRLLSSIEGWGTHTGELDVGLHPSGASPYGALDMAGNVWEWVADWYDDAYYQQSPYYNPLGPDSGTHKVVRGGAWESRSAHVRCARRDLLHPDWHYGEVGFRCVADVPATSSLAARLVAIQTRPIDEMVIVYVPGGKLETAIGDWRDESNMVVLSSYWIDRRTNTGSTLHLDQRGGGSPGVISLSVGG
jgi:formylglycine-generating enzyme required for sulfatase activity